MFKELFGAVTQGNIVAEMGDVRISKHMGLWRPG